MEMTAPVLMTNKTMAFTLSKNFTLENAPQPTNKNIHLKVIIFNEKEL